MFNLETAIATWRRFLGSARGVQKDDLDELEAHLRDEIDALVAEGLAPEAAFKEARRRMGEYTTVEAAYEQLYWHKLRADRKLPDELKLRAAMLTNYFKIALRNFKRAAGFTVLNAGGLAVGIGCVLLIALYVRHEVSYDRFHTQADRIYRVVYDRLYDSGQVRSLAPTSGPLAPELEATLPEVEQAVRLFVPHHTTGQSLLRHGDTRFHENRFFYADPDVFEVFSFTLLQGDPATALARPASVVVTEAMAHKYFGETDPMGRTLVLDDSVALEVTGVMRDLPGPTHLDVDFLAPFDLLVQQYDDDVATLWGWDLMHTYLLVQPDASQEAVTGQIQAYLDEHVAPRTLQRGYRYDAALQPLRDIHLTSNREWELEPGSSTAYPMAFSLIGLFVLLIAGINFINAATARAGLRAREVGVRKVLGSQRAQLIGQFLCESTLLSLLATLLGVLLAWALLPLFASVAGVSLHLGDLPPGWLLGGPVLVTLVVGLGAGSFPAFYLASMEPTKTLKGTFRAGGGGLRRGLVVVQFVLSILLVSGTAVVVQQLRYVQRKQLGFDQEQMLVLKTGEINEAAEAMKDELLRNPAIQHVSAVSGTPGGQVEQMLVLPEGQTETVSVEMLWVDHDFAETFGIRLLAGRDLSEVYPTDATSAYLINETAARAFGWSDPLGKNLTWISGWGRREGAIIGVMEDFHTSSLRQRIAPLVLVIQPVYRHLALRVQTDDVAGLQADLAAWWAQTRPGHPFEARFLDQSFAHLYASEQRQARLFGGFAALAVLLACSGLFGLAAFTAARRRKEVGIRKVLGASLKQILVLLLKEYVWLVLLAGIVAGPAAYLIAGRWLDAFAYRIEMSGWTFLLVGLAALGVVLVTVSYHAVRAAATNPVKSLRYE